jgi:hypothetical protein
MLSYARLFLQECRVKGWVADPLPGEDYTSRGVQLQQVAEYIGQQRQTRPTEALQRMDWRE